MAIDSLYNIASIDGSVLDISWETTADWDNAVSESSIRHDTTTLEMVPQSDSFEDLADSDPVPAGWNAQSASITNSFASDGALSIDNNYEPTTFNNAKDDPAFASTNIGPEQPDEITFAYRELSTSAGIAFEVWNEDNTAIVLRVGTANPQVGYNNTDVVISSPTPNYESYRRFTLSMDWANNEYDLLWEDLDGSTPDQTVTGIPFMNAASGTDATYIGASDNVNWDGSNALPNGDEWVDEVYGAPVQSSLTTATKSFTTPTKPNLQNLTYTLNSENITLDVIGSPGTGSEEIVTQILDGSTSYNLSWSNYHSDFRVKVTLDSAGRVNRPTLSKVELARE